MIISSLLTLLFSSLAFIVSGIFALIPDFNFLSASVLNNISSSLSWFLGLVDYMNPVIPKTTVLIVLGFYVTFYSVYIGFKFVSWVLRKIPMLGLS